MLNTETEKTQNILKFAFFGDVSTILISKIKYFRHRRKIMESWKRV